MMSSPSTSTSLLSPAVALSQQIEVSALKAEETHIPEIKMSILMFNCIFLPFMYCLSRKLGHCTTGVENLLLLLPQSA